MSPSNNPVLVVDKIIGTAYDVVRAVYLKMTELMYLVDNMDQIVTVANHLGDSTLVTGVAGPVNTSVLVPLPTGVLQSKVRASSVFIFANNKLYGTDSGFFTALIDGTNLDVVVDASAPSGLVGGAIRWYVTYES